MYSVSMWRWSVKVGDLVQCWSTEESGIIVDIDPLRRHQMSKQGQPGYEMIEIVVMLPCGTMWHAAPRDWSVIVTGESPCISPCKQTPAVV